MHKRTFDIFLLDEKHECATIQRMSQILPIRCRRAYAFSANHNDRVDQADDWLVSMFGENRVRVDYKDVLSNKDITPIEVKWKRILASR